MPRSILDVARKHDRNLDTYRSTEMHGLVSSYDPKNHLAKVTFQPWGYESGWLPIHTSHIGQTYGYAVGLQTGSGMGGQDGGSGSGGSGGGSSSGGQGAGSGLQGDQVIVSYQEDDSAGGKITGRVHSTQDKPLQVQSGEMAMWTVFKQDSDAGPDSAQSGQKDNTGQKLFFKNDGGLYSEDGAGAAHFLDGKGNATHNAKGKHTTQIISQRDSSPFDSLSDKQGGSSSPKQIHHTTLDKDKGVTTGAFNDQHKTTWDQSGVTHTSSGAVTSKAPNIPHQGNTSVTQNLSVGQVVTAQNYITGSDVRLKSKISPLRSMLDKVMALAPKTFLKKKIDYAVDGSESISPELPVPLMGFIAQEVRDVLPEIVHGNEAKGYLSIAETQLIPVMVAAFQEYVARTDRRIAELEAKLQGH